MAVTSGRMAALQSSPVAALSCPAPKAPWAGRLGVPPPMTGQAANWARIARRRSSWNRWSHEARSTSDKAEEAAIKDNGNEDTIEDVNEDTTFPRLSWVKDDEGFRPRAYLIFNPVAGQGDLSSCLGTITSTLLPSMDLVILQTTPDISAASLTKKALDEDADIVIASGGDGTISEVSGELIGSGKALGIIPRGTANAFSVALGIPTHLDNRNYIEAACNVILAGQQRIVDAAWASGEWGKWPLTLLLGIGLEAAMVEKADRGMKDMLGPLAYIVAGVKALKRDSPYFDLVGDFDGVKTTTSRTHAVTIANAAPPASLLAQGLGQVIPDDGLLEMMAFVDEDVGSAQRNIFNMAVKQMISKTPGVADLEDDLNVIGLRAKNVTLTCDPPQKVVVDGELLGQTPVTVEVVPGGLVVIAPLPDDEESRERASLALASELARLRKVMADHDEDESELSEKQLRANNKIMVARAKQIEKDLVDHYGFEKDSLQDLEGILKSSS